MTGAEHGAQRPSGRRIVLVGVLVASIVAVIGAPRYLSSIEGDLSVRVVDELTSSGFSGTSASFDGQLGTVRCEAPLADPEFALDVANEVHGVRLVTFDRSCRVSSAPVVSTTLPPVESAPPTSGADTTDTDTTDTTSDAVESTEAEDIGDPTDDPDTTVAAPAFDSLADLLAADPQFSIFDSLVGEAALVDFLVTERPLTMFAPTDAAFELVAPDVLAELRRRPELMAAVVRHHLVAELLPSGELVSGPVTTLDGAVLGVEVAAGSLTVAGALVTTADLTAVNGFAHAIDRVLLPDGLDLVSLRPTPSLVAIVDGGGVDLSGLVADEAQREQVRAAALAVLEPSNVTDDLTVDASAGLDAPTAAAFATMIQVAARALGGGSVTVTDGVVAVTGTVAGDDGRQALAAAAGGAGALLEVVDRPVAADADAATLEAELNELAQESPIVFEPNSSELVDGTAAVLDRLAGSIRRWDGVVVTVAGFTDTAGTPARNEALSEQRAAAVLVQLTARGVPVGQLDAVGFGSTSPILVDGAEDPVASRRVEFRVATGVALAAES